MEKSKRHRKLFSRLHIAMSASSYPETLARWVSNHKQKRSPDANLVAFLAARDDIRAALDLGYSSATIYAHLHETGRVRCSYETFRRYIKRLVLTERESKQRTLKVKKTEKTGITGFNFNAKPDKEDLI